MQFHRHLHSVIMTRATNQLLGLLAKLARLLAIEAEGTYRPERHYMRGPGPKWREKHASFVRPEGRSFN